MTLFANAGRMNASDSTPLSISSKSDTNGYLNNLVSCSRDIACKISELTDQEDWAIWRPVLLNRLIVRFMVGSLDDRWVVERW